MKLRIITEAGAERFYDVRDHESIITLGRSDQCDVTLDEKRASRKHCQIEKAVDGYYLVDVDGNAILDLFSSFDLDTLDYNHPRLLTAAKNRVFTADDIAPATNLDNILAGTGSSTEPEVPSARSHTSIGVNVSAGPRWPR